MGPFHGNALRVQFEAAPPVGKALNGFAQLTINARTYKRISSGILFAGRVDVLESKGADAFMLMCGPDMLRGCDYGSMIGNRILYASAELRFPIFDAFVLPHGFAIGPIRGLLLADAGMTKFSGEKYAAQKGTSIGFGVQFTPFSIIWTRKSNGKWVPTFYYRIDW